MARAVLRQIIGGEYTNENVRKLIGKISNGFEYWFTFVIHPGVEPTNNKAERAIREHVVQRKIIGILRNEKGLRFMNGSRRCWLLGLNRDMIVYKC